MLNIKFIKNKSIELQKLVANWARDNHFRLILFNMIVVILFLLHSVGYFAPFFPITVNFIVLICLIISIFVFRAKSNLFFLIAILFWLLATLFKFFQIEAWVERTTIYVFQSLIVGVALMAVESIREK